jgi:glycosyltransferase 2 family protein
MLRRLVQWIQPIVFVLALVAIGWFLAEQWPALRSYPWRLHWGWFLVTCLFTLASWGLEIAIWRYILAALGGYLPYWVAARIWFLSAIVRYIPGNVWQPLSLTLYSRRYGVTPEASLTSIVLFQVVMLLAIVPILVVYFVWIDTKSLAAQFVADVPPALMWSALIPVLAFVFRPQWLLQLLNWGLRRFNRPPLAMQLTSATLLALILVSLLDWLLWGGVFAAFTFAVASDGLGGNGLERQSADWLALAPLLIAAYPIANMAGLISFITPSGFGAREGVFYLLLTPQLAGSVVTVIALGVRVWGLLTEILGAVISYPIERAAHLRRASSPPTNDTALPDALVAPQVGRETP